MAQITATPVDPIVAALPPETDYITYLTVLEYNLTPQKLPLINDLLEADDGSLAENIGWDLLSIVLPMLDEQPSDATQCLQIISRRANPREVVIQVAGELEKLETEPQEDENVEFDDGDEDELRTFEGEAQRIHLGELTLNGVRPRIPQRIDEPDQGNEDSTNESHSISRKDRRFMALLQMLSILHPRIKTRHPSRFLATSLKAAIGAYRSLPATSATTIAFIDFLRTQRRSPEKVSSAPRLPPRRGMEATAPEEDKEGDGAMENTGEEAIGLRLLQAAMLEVLEFYVVSIEGNDTSDMAWTTRLRDRFESKHGFPGRTTETDRWSKIPGLKERDAILSRFVLLGRDLKLSLAHIQDLVGAIDELGHYSEPDELSTELEPDSEYPTAPEQIPLSQQALVYLHTSIEFTQAIGGNSDDFKNIPPTFGLWEIARLSLYLLSSDNDVQHDRVSGPAFPPPSPLLDAVLALLYMNLTRNSRKEQIVYTPDPTRTLLFDQLVEIFTSSPNSTVRDNAHQIASFIFSSSIDLEWEIRTIERILRMSVFQDQPNHPNEPSYTAASASQMLSARLKAVAVDWLKQELVYRRTNPMNVFEEDNDLLILLFPTIPAPPQASSSALPTTLSPTMPEAREGDSVDQVDDFLCNLSFYISTLNLLYICMTSVYDEFDFLRTAIRDIVKERLQAFTPWRSSLLDFMDQARHNEGHGNDGERQKADEGGQQVLESMSDIWAFDDAMGRLERAFQEKDGHIEGTVKS